MREPETVEAPNHFCRQERYHCCPHVHRRQPSVTGAQNGCLVNMVVKPWSDPAAKLGSICGHAPKPWSKGVSCWSTPVNNSSTVRCRETQLLHKLEQRGWGGKPTPWGPTGCSSGALQEPLGSGLKPSALGGTSRTALGQGKGSCWGHKRPHAQRLSVLQQPRHNLPIETIKMETRTSPINTSCHIVRIAAVGTY